MKLLQKIVCATFLCCFSISIHNCAMAAKTAKTLIAVNKTETTIRKGYERALEVAQSAFSFDSYAASLDFVASLYDTFRIKTETGNHLGISNQIIHFNSDEHHWFENLHSPLADQKTTRATRSLTDFAAVNTNLDLEWVVSLSETWKAFGGFGYLQQTFQHQGRLTGPTNSANDKSSPDGRTTSFQTCYNLIYPLIGMEKHMSRNSKISAVIKFPAYGWTEYEIDDPAVEQFNTTGMSDSAESTGTGFSGGLSFNRKFSDTMFLKADLRYTIIEPDGNSIALQEYGFSDSMESKQLGANVKLGITL